MISQSLVSCTLALALTQCALVGYDSIPPQHDDGSGDQSGGGRSIVGGVVNSGGASGSGGNSSAGGVASTGGDGGSANSGGDNHSGGDTTAGTDDSGGDVATGGMNGSGGDTATGGVSDTGGVTKTGGVASTGGVSNTGGIASTGGVSNAGGVIATGGVSNTGGIASTGGITNTGGVGATGGVASTGGDVTVPDAGINFGSLIHRYSFDPTVDNTLVKDLVGTADGQLSGGATFDNSGQAQLDGSSGYISLPSGIISELTSATFVFWATYTGSSCLERLFDFGSSASSLSLNTVVCAPSIPAELAGFPVVRYIQGLSYTLFGGTSAFTTNTPHMVAVTIDADVNLLSWYLDGVLMASGTLTFSLSSLSDTNNWLGKSNSSGEPFFPGSYDEVRIYNEALSEPSLQEILNAGPDVLP